MPINAPALALSRRPKPYEGTDALCFVLSHGTAHDTAHGTHDATPLAPSTAGKQRSTAPPNNMTRSRCTPPSFIPMRE
jgi:hypothetical protein